jgi:aminoglycoside phosphotransferase family enzyme/predicted kinase
MTRHPANQAAVTDFLSTPASHAGTGPVEVIDTHISKLFLVGDRAFKLKRAVDLPYAHFATPELRHETCEKEVALNTPNAPGLYLGVRKITQTASGELAFDGDGRLVDSVVEMVRFKQGALFDQMATAGELTAPLLNDLAGTIAQAHDLAPVVHTGSGSDNMAGVLDINRAGFGTSNVFTEAEVNAFDAAFRRRLERHAETLDDRERSGLVRRCHGDLHLRNICMFEGRPTLFDCIDFSDQIATVDVLYDLAFLLMDLWHRGFHDFANLVANRYFDATGTQQGYELLPFFMAVRAAVRAHVTATFAEQAAEGMAEQAGIARQYFELGRTILEAKPAGILALGGLSGSGKTTVAEALAPKFGAPPGARIVESDRTRKALFNLPAENALPEAAYRSEVSDEVYRHLGAAAGSLVNSGASAIVGAVFDRPERRDALEAAVSGLPFTGVWLSAAPVTLRRRVEMRPKGASDADLPILERQLEQSVGQPGWEVVSAEARPDEIVASILDLLRAKQQQSPPRPEHGTEEHG